MARALGYLILGLNLSNSKIDVDESVDFLETLGLNLFYANNTGDHYVGIAVACLDEAKNLNWEQLVEGKNKVSQAYKLGSDDRMELAAQFAQAMQHPNISDELKRFLAETPVTMQLVWGES